MLPVYTFTLAALLLGKPVEREPVSGRTKRGSITSFVLALTILCLLVTALQLGARDYRQQATALPASHSQ